MDLDENPFLIRPLADTLTTQQRREIDSVSATFYALWRTVLRYAPDGHSRQCARLFLETAHQWVVRAIVVGDG